MAERRMFAKAIVLSDAFLDMPLSARCLYFTLGMFADDDGFVGSPKGIMRQCGASQDDMLVLIQKRFVLAFDSGVIVIKHWRINNYLQNDRHKETTYIEELQTLDIDDKGAYTEKASEIKGLPTMYTDCIQNVYTDKNSIDKDSKEKNSKDISAGAKPKKKDKPVKNKYGSQENVLLTDEEYERLKKKYPDCIEDAIEYLSLYIAEKKYKSESHNLAIQRWVIDAVRKKKPANSSFELKV